MKAIDSKLLRKFVHLAADRLKGRWVLLGGTLLPLLGVEHRVTTDIDLVGLGSGEQGQALALMELAEELGLPVEAINQAAGFFLMKHQPFEDHLIELIRGKSATLYRPDLYLFLALKIGRLSATDLGDCLEMVRREPPLSAKDRARISKQIRKESEKSGSPEERRRRLLDLREALGIPAARK